MKTQNNLAFLLNKKGQMAVFIVLIFQVLFVLFAMVVNIGLVVHDKINLQNSVDLAAYYAAQRQAESLNVIAHQNYQIRQAWKLLAWRYFVLGTSSQRIGTKLIHPAAVGVSNSNTENKCYSGFQEYSAEGSRIAAWRCKKIPVICMSDIYPWEVSKNDQLCRNLKLTVQSLQAPSDIAGGIVGSLRGVIKQVKELNNLISARCEQASDMQIIFASSILTAFDHEQSNRLKILYGVAKGLSASIDIDNKSIKEGAFTVFKKNLSYANFKSTNRKNFDLWNSVNKSVALSNWLVPIVVNPAIIFSKFKTSLGTGGCTASAGTAVVLSTTSFGKNNGDGAKAFRAVFKDNAEALILQSRGSINKMGPRNKAKHILSFINAKNPAVINPQFLTVGVEKNPWYRVYVGVKASSSPQELFWIGKPIQLQATAFASPFGGRVGPWDGTTWPSGALNSQAGKNSRVDALLPLRDLLSGGAEHIKKNAVHEFIPNFSRFPGDKRGLFSSEALAAVPIGKDRKVKFSINKLVQSAFDGNIQGDGGVHLFAKSTLSQKGSNANSPRNMEIAAISPNLFDITYYSVFPDARKSFMGRVASFQSKKSKIVVRDDVGNYMGDNEVTTLKKRVNSISKSPLKVKVNPKYGRFVTKAEELLTAWLPNGPYTYDFNPSSFQVCGLWSESGDAPVTGACAAGGRVGYSVKIISRNLLSSTDLPLGGSSTTGRIANPPPSDF